MIHSWDKTKYGVLSKWTNQILRISFWIECVNVYWYWCVLDKSSHLAWNPIQLNIRFWSPLETMFNNVKMSAYRYGSFLKPKMLRCIVLLSLFLGDIMGDDTSDDYGPSKIMGFVKMQCTVSQPLSNGFTWQNPTQKSLNNTFIYCIDGVLMYYN